MILLMEGALKLKNMFHKLETEGRVPVAGRLLRFSKINSHLRHFEDILHACRLW